jgi:glucose-1-phosphate thymidylyltransferase
MLKVAGKPVMDYVLDDVRKLGGVDEVIYITGHLKDAVERHARTQYADLRATFIEQVVQDGTAGAVALARARVDQPVLIIFVDTIFDADLSVIRSCTDDGIIWTKEVEDYQRFGVVVTGESGHMARIVEKPDTPISRRANIGLYYVTNWKLLFDGIDHVLGQPANKGEFYLTDAFQYMIEQGARLQVIDVEGWYDAGKLDTLLETNEVMLRRGRARRPADLTGAAIVEPVYIEDGVRCDGATIGPNVSIGAGTVIRKSRLRNTIVGSHTTIAGCTLDGSMIGDHAVVEGVHGTLAVGDHGDVRSA